MYDDNYPLGCSTRTTAVHGWAGPPPRPSSASEPRRMDCHELGPRYTWQEAVAAGLTRAQLRDEGIRITRGAYVSRAVPLTLRSACLSVVPVLPEAATFLNLTAAALLEAPVRVAWPLTVAVPLVVYRPRRRRVRVHVRDLLPEDAVRIQNLPFPSGLPLRL